ncbi:MAG: flagellar basal body rod protein FlgC [Phycisphaerales bacterium]|nr:MAG: flagellar basal body rod protein FlgC [Phycisphaerales bacterium]
MLGSLDISTSGLIAQRTRLNVVAANVANKDTILNENGEYEPFRRRIAHLAAGDPSRGEPMGVHVSNIELDDGTPMLKYEPGSPFADENGYVGYPNINPVVEQMNAMEAARSYEANIAAIEATKSMTSIALQLLG